jgi:hypothetical protein
MNTSTNAYHIQELFFTLFLAVSYALIFVSYLGFYNSAPEYLSKMNYYFNIYLCLFLLWRFNPFRKLDTFTELDRKIAFSAGVFIMTTTALNQYIIEIQNTIKKAISYFEKKV